MSSRRRSLVKSDALMHRHYFKEMLKLYGIDGMYFQVKEDTINYNETGELSAEYLEPIPCQMIFDQVPKVSTLKKLGWTTELDQSQPLIHVDFDLKGLQIGACFNIEDPLRPGKGRLFRVTKLSVGIIYPMCVTCQIVAILGDKPEKTLQPEKALSINEELGRKIIRPAEYD